MLVRNLSKRGGSGKLRSYWEDTVHQFVERKGEVSPVYEVKPENSVWRSRVIHGSTSGQNPWKSETSFEEKKLAQDPT